MGRTCGEPDEIKKNTHPEYITALFCERVLDPDDRVVLQVLAHSRQVHLRGHTGGLELGSRADP